MSGVPARSLAALNALRCQVFGTSYNPNNVRTGAKYLKKSLVGSCLLYTSDAADDMQRRGKKAPHWKGSTKEGCVLPGD